MNTNLRDIEIKKYRRSADGQHLIIEYKDNNVDVLNYSKELELEVLKKYKEAILSQRTRYRKAKTKVKKNRQFIIATLVIGTIALAVSIAANMTVLPYIIYAFTGKGLYGMVKNQITVNRLKKQIALAENVTKINEKRESKITPMDRQLGKEAELFNLSRHNEYTKKEAKEIIRDAGGNDYELTNPVTRAHQKVKTKIKKKLNK